MDPAQINTKAATDALQHSLKPLLSLGIGFWATDFTYKETDSAMMAICVGSMVSLGMLSILTPEGTGWRAG